MAQNTFSDVVNQVQQSPQNQRSERLIDGIAQQMQQSGNQQTQQLGQELKQVKPQFNKEANIYAAPDCALFSPGPLPHIS
jgi:hypothetical protein